MSRSGTKEVWGLYTKAALVRERAGSIPANEQSDSIIRSTNRRHEARDDQPEKSAVYEPSCPVIPVISALRLIYV